MAVGIDAQEHVGRLAAVGDEHRFIDRDSLGVADVLIEFSAAEALQGGLRNRSARTAFCVTNVGTLLLRGASATEIARGPEIDVSAPISWLCSAVFRSSWPFLLGTGGDLMISTSTL